MNIQKGELQLAKPLIDEHLDRLIDWSVGDIRKCCRLNEDGSCDENGSLVGAFILWCCAIEYLGGLYTGLTEAGNTRARFKEFIQKYMPNYDARKVEDLRWSLSHYYSPHHFVLYHEGNFEKNGPIHLTQTARGIMLHLGWAIRDLEQAAAAFRSDVEASEEQQVKIWRFYKEQLPIMPVEVESLIQPSMASQATGSALQSVNASGTVGPEEWSK